MGTGGWECGKKGAGGWRREDVKRESQGGGNWEELSKFCNILLYFTIEMGQRKGNRYTKGWEPGLWPISSVDGDFAANLKIHGGRTNQL